MLVALVALTLLQGDLLGLTVCLNSPFPLPLHGLEHYVA